MAEKVKKEKFIRISRRTNVKWWQQVIIIGVSILVAFLLCGLISNIAAPGSFGEYYEYLFKGTFSTPRIFMTLLWNTAIMLLVAVALTPSFKMRFWNIGAEGQCLMGALGTVIGLYFIAPHVPTFLAIIIELALAIIFAVIWAVIPAIFKAYLNTNETLFTLMMNYIAAGIVVSFIKFNANSGSGTIIPLNTDTHAGWLPIIEFFNNSYVYNIIIIALAASAIFVYLKYSKHGYELSVVGNSQNTARYVGINVKTVIIRTSIVTGIVCGLVGFLCCAGGSHTIEEGIIGGRGFTAILICWIGNFNVPLMLFYSFLITFVSSGSSTAASWLDYPNAISKVSTALFFVILIACSFFINFRISIPVVKKFFRKVFRNVVKIVKIIIRWFRKLFRMVKNYKEEESEKELSTDKESVEDNVEEESK